MEGGVVSRRARFGESLANRVCTNRASCGKPNGDRFQSASHVSFLTTSILCDLEVLYREGHSSNIPRPSLLESHLTSPSVRQARVRLSRVARARASPASFDKDPKRESPSLSVETSLSLSLSLSRLWVESVRRRKPRARPHSDSHTLEIWRPNRGFFKTGKTRERERERPSICEYNCWVTGRAPARGGGHGA